MRHKVVALIMGRSTAAYLGPANQALIASDTARIRRRRRLGRRELWYHQSAHWIIWRPSQHRTQSTESAPGVVLKRGDDGEGMGDILAQVRNPGINGQTETTTTTSDVILDLVYCVVGKVVVEREIGFIL